MREREFQSKVQGCRTKVNISRVLMFFSILMASAFDLKEHVARAVEAHKTQNYQVAMQHYTAALELQPALPAIHNNRAAVALALGQRDTAEQAWREAIRLKPDYAEAYFNLAVSLSERPDGSTLDEALRHCEIALGHRQGYVAAHHLMGNILVSKGRNHEATSHYQIAEQLAPDAAVSSVREIPRLNGVTQGQEQIVEIERAGTRSSFKVTTLSISPLVFLVDDFLSDTECEQLIQHAEPHMAESKIMGNVTSTERTSQSTFLPVSSLELLSIIQERMYALLGLSKDQAYKSEDLQVVHYREGAAFGMHHDSSAFLPRHLTAFYYLNDVDGGGETVFPAAEGALAISEAMALSTDELASAPGLRVKPRKRAALIFYNHKSDGALDGSAVHAGSRVTRGAKWGANHWIRLGE